MTPHSTMAGRPSMGRMVRYAPLHQEPRQQQTVSGPHGAEQQLFVSAMLTQRRVPWSAPDCDISFVVLSVILQSLLGQVDLAFLSAYAFGMFFAGHLGDRLDLRIFLTVGMLGSGIFCCLFGWVSWP